MDWTGLRWISCHSSASLLLKVASGSYFVIILASFRPRLAQSVRRESPASSSVRLTGLLFTRLQLTFSAMLAFPAPSLLIATLALAASAAGQAMNGTLDSNNTTVANATTNANTTWTTQPQPVTTNDYCGPQYGNMSCVIDGILPCCSSKG